MSTLYGLGLHRLALLPERRTPSASDAMMQIERDLLEVVDEPLPKRTAVEALLRVAHTLNIMVFNVGKAKVRVDTGSAWNAEPSVVVPYKLVVSGVGDGYHAAEEVELLTVMIPDDGHPARLMVDTGPERTCETAVDLTVALADAIRGLKPRLRDLRQRAMQS